MNSIKEAIKNKTCKCNLLFRFSEQQYIQEFYKKGTIWMNPINSFKKISNTIKRDTNENMTNTITNGELLLKTKDGDKKIADIEKGFIYIPQNDPFGITHIFCLSAFSEETYERNDCKIFDDRLLEHGQYMIVIYNPEEFYNRFKSAIKKKKKEVPNIISYCFNIQYVNKDEYVGSLDAFTKFDSFSHEQEMRFAVSHFDKFNEPFVLNIGSLEDIAIIRKTKDFVNMIVIEEKEYKVIL